MALTKLNFTKDWNNPSDFPTIEVSEAAVRSDMQDLWDQTKAGVNTIATELEATTGAKQIGASAPAGVAGTNVQDIISSLKTLIDAKANDATVSSTYETKAAAGNHITGVSLNESTGVFTFTRENGTSFTIDTLLEKVATNFTYDSANQRLVLTLKDGTVQYISLSDFITETEFIDSDDIDFNVANHKVTATITDSYKNTLTGLKNAAATSAANAGTSESNASTYADNARASATSAQSSDTDAANQATAAESYAKGGTGSRQGENTDNAKYYAEQAAGSDQSAYGLAIQASTSAQLAESWAKGETGVRAGEATNNSKYWSQVAYDTVMDKNSIYIGTETPADTYKVWIDTDDETEPTPEHVDFTPTQNSGNLISSGGVWNALNGIGITPDPYPTQGSNHSVSSGGTWERLEAKADKSTTYTKTETDTLLGGKANTGVSYTKSESDNKYVAYSVAQSLDDTAKAQARENIGATTETYVNGKLSNRNMLDNPFFQINQRDGYIVLAGKTATENGTPSNVITTDKPYKIINTWTYAGDGTKYGQFVYTDGKTYDTNFNENCVSGYVHSSTNGFEYGFDRWFTLYDGSYTHKTGNVITAKWMDCGTVFENKDFPKDTIFTFSVKFASGTIASIKIRINSSNNWLEYVDGNRKLVDSNGDYISANFLNEWQAGKIHFFMQTYNASNVLSEVKFVAMKLELGTVSTLANDVAPNYAEELAKCQSRYLPLKALNGSTLNNFASGVYFPDWGVSPFAIPTPVTMKPKDNTATGGISIVDVVRTGDIAFVNGVVKLDVGINIDSIHPNAIRVYANVDKNITSGITPCTLVDFNFAFSTDL